MALDHLRNTAITKPTQTCAKFLISGEYSVLLGAPAIAIPLHDLKLNYFEVPSVLETEFWVNDKKLIEPHDLGKLQTLRSVFLRDETKNKPVKVEIHTSIPIGKGLGSSAALSVAMARYHNPKFNPSEISELALSGEKLFHGNPSGVDPYCISFEKPIVFSINPRRAEDLDLKSLIKSNLIFVLRDSGGTHSTGEQLKLVMNHSSLIRELAGLSKQMLEAINHDCSKIGALMNKSHEILKEAGASSTGIEANIAQLKELGAQELSSLVQDGVDL